jgi:sporulation protein YlmC with PRC-barrel domain
MSWKVTDLKGDDVLARDGAIGKLDDVYFDDERWAVRYMVVDTGGWIAGRRMLVSPEAIEAGISDPGKLRVAATREQLKDAPGAEAAPPVAEQQRLTPEEDLGEGDPHLRSSNEVIGYDVQALDGTLGSVEDFVIDESSWRISDVVIDTARWWPGGKVRLGPEQVDHIDWAARKLHVRLSRDELKAARA